MENEEFVNNSSNKKSLIIILIISIIIISLIGTYAWFTWTSKENTELTLTIGELADVSFSTGNDINVDNIGPVLDYTKNGEITTFSLRNKSELELLTNINLNISNLPEELKEESFKYILLSSNDNNIFTEVVSGNFKDKSNGIVSLVKEEPTKVGTTYYKFIIYIDGNMENPIDMMGKSFNAKIEVEVNTKALDKSGANPPDLLEGLIPIMYKDNKWVKADEANGNEIYQWYDYDKQMWANAVLVTDTSRSTYKNASVGTEVKENDILAYYVWIPRYKYKLFNALKKAGVDSYSARTTGIDIVFESGIESTGTVKCTIANNGVESCTGASNGAYYTHPAFTFGNIELMGIWVGKFELTGSTGKPTVKPNLTPLKDVNTSTIFTTIAKISGSSNTYGINSSEADSHMMKNMEWGAVAYLSNSKYGRCLNGSCTEIGINNNSSNKTGCGAAPGSSSSSSCNTYTTPTGMLASTTNNIYGVYDMSGGTSESVMGTMLGDDGNFHVEYSGFSKAPNIKYYDKYSYGTSDIVGTRGHLGDATSEIVVSGNTGWYSDYASFVGGPYHWLDRGSTWRNSNNSGIFNFSYNDNAFSYGSTGRAVLVSIK